MRKHQFFMPLGPLVEKHASVLTAAVLGFWCLAGRKSGLVAGHLIRPRPIHILGPMRGGIATSPSRQPVGRQIDRKGLGQQVVWEKQKPGRQRSSLMSAGGPKSGATGYTLTWRRSGEVAINPALSRRCPQWDGIARSGNDSDAPMGLGDQFATTEK